MSTTDALAPRADFPLLARHPGLHYLDSAATSQKPRAVLDAITGFYETTNANPHRGAYTLAAEATQAYADARATVARFLGARDVESLVFTRGTTEAMNLLASSWGRSIGPGDEIVVTAMDHHAVFVTWQQLARATGARFRIVELTGDGRIDLEHLRASLSLRTKVVAFPHISNALGTVNPVREIVHIVRGHSPALIALDGAQSAPHAPVDVTALDVDAFAFSGHKMLGPMGIGGVVVRRALLDRMAPWQYGGDMIEIVHDEDSSWNRVPHRFEAGTPNAADAVGLAAAVRYLEGIGMARAFAHEQALAALADEKLSALEGFTRHGPAAAHRAGIVSFTLAAAHPHDLATILDQHGVCVRAGHHCTQPLMRRLGVAATARASFHVYSSTADVDALVSALGAAQELFAEEHVA
ncbi:MAG: cysteine desulfurase [Gemmatimonadaceae bacterium]|nr:cysteine desulfurase [Gemmatimonadaceae bacterium]